MTKQEKQAWNNEVKGEIEKIKSVLPWLKEIEQDPDKDYDWETQKSAHQAARFIELAMWEMWNLQYWYNKKQRRLWEESTQQVADEDD